jgi:transcriptional regulator with XRE-family HTH domain
LTQTTEPLYYLSVVQQISVNSLSGILKELRVASRMTQVELAEKLGCTQQQIANIENKNSKWNPKLKTLQRVAEAMGVEVVVTLKVRSEALDVTSGERQEGGEGVAWEKS